MRLGRGLVLLIMTGLAILTVFLGIAEVLDADEPVYFGTFTEERCEGAGRHGCRSIGTWVSDDGSIRVEDIQLDGHPESDGTQKASYQPTGIRNDADVNIVHGPFGHAVEPYVPLAVLAITVVPLVRYLRLWRGSWRPPGRPGRTSP